MKYVYEDDWFVCVNKNNTELLMRGYPYRTVMNNWDSKYGSISLKDGMIKSIIGKSITWEDYPVKINISFKS